MWAGEPYGSGARGHNNAKDEPGLGGDCEHDRDVGNYSSRPKRFRSGDRHRQRSWIDCRSSIRWLGRERIANVRQHNVPANSSLVGGELPGDVKMKLSDKVINLRGNVGVGDNGGNFKAGVGLPF